VRRRDLLRVSAAASLGPLVVAVHTGERVNRLGLLMNASITDTRRLAETFVRELADRGWRDGDNLRVEIDPMMGMRSGGAALRASWCAPA
jgi:hypothetical protein